MRRAFSASPRLMQGLRIGYVPEHFSTPLYFAQKHFGLNASLVPYPSGTGHMVQSFKARDIDVGIGLTEGWIAGLGNNQGAKADQPYRIVGTYVETPLCWAISTGARREDIADVAALRGKKIGVSRIGSGSYVMGFVLADQYGWLKEGTNKQPFEVVPLDTFKGLRDGVNDGTADFFMWEHFTSKRYYDNGEIKKIGEIYTPWSSWKIVAADSTDKRLEDMAQKLNQGIKHFESHKEEAVKYISTELDYSEEDARDWMHTVRFARDVHRVDPAVVEKTVDILGKAGVLDAQAVKTDDVIAVKRAAKAEST